MTVSPAPWVDIHCHLGDYPDSHLAAEKAHAAGVRVIGSTCLPSEYRALRDTGMMTGLGFHPMHAAHPDRDAELVLYRAEVARAVWISEVGLDDVMPAEGGPALADQETLFAEILAPDLSHAILSVHSRLAEERTIQMLTESSARAVALHWFSGPISAARRAADAGMYFSVNPMMTKMAAREDFLRWIPADRLLWETDGPQPDDDTAVTVWPSDIPAAAARVAALRGVAVDTLREQTAQTFTELQSRRK